MVRLAVAILLMFFISLFLLVVIPVALVDRHLQKANKHIDEADPRPYNGD